MFSSITSSVSSWLGATQPDEEVSTDKPIQDGEQAASKPGEDTARSEDKESSETQDIQHQIDELGTKAVTTAKEWGNWLYDVGKNATTEVVKTAHNVKKTVEEKTILGDFQKEQEKFVAENRDKQSKSEAAVPPWVGYNEEESMKQQITALSTDKRNFLRNPPAGVQFNFDFEASFPVAMATLQEDANLKKMRFDLVPKQVKEDVFWRNYFYRVSLIKQSAQLTSLAHQTESKTASPDKTVAKSESSSTSSASSVAAPGGDVGRDVIEPEELLSTSPPENEFISDEADASALNQEDLKKEMQQLGMSSEHQEDIPEWERELQAELQEYEVVADGGDDLDDADLEQELMQQIEAEAEAKK